MTIFNGEPVEGFPQVVVERPQYEWNPSIETADIVEWILPGGSKGIAIPEPRPTRWQRIKSAIANFFRRAAK